MVSRLRAAIAMSLVALVSGGVSGCGVPMRPARLSVAEAPSQREFESRTAIRSGACRPEWGWLWPGLGHLCLGETAAGATLATVGAGESSLLLYGLISHDSRTPFPMPAIAVRNLWTISGLDMLFRGQLADQRMYTPADTLGELFYAPFNYKVMTHWTVLTSLALSIGSALLESYLRVPTGHIDRPRIVGVETTAAVGFTAATGIYGAFTEQVAVGEEMLYRGLLQSSFARECGQGCGYGIGAAAFAAAHIPNAFLADDPADYFQLSFPIVAVMGAYWGGMYYANDYSLAPNVAAHFWHNMIGLLAHYLRHPDSPAWLTPVVFSISLPSPF